MAEGGGALVGRARELSAIEDALGCLDGAGAALHVQVVGEAGIGKTRLLEELSDRAERRRHLVLTSRATEFETELPLGPFLGALDDYLASISASLREALGPWLPELAAVFPALSRSGVEGPPALFAERYRTFGAIRALLEELARPRPLVLVLDDLHWADPTTCELLGHLLAHPPRAAVGVVVAFRPQVAGVSPTRILIASAGRADVRRIELMPLTPTEANELIGGRIAASVGAEMIRESGGNPFYLEQLLRQGDHQTGQPAANATDDTVPGAVLEAINRELAVLSPSARTLLEAAAVTGDPFDDDLSAMVALKGELESLVLIDELVGRDLIRPTLVPRRFRFRHPIVRRAVYESAGAGWRFGAHERAAAALRGRGLAAASFAHHVERSARIGDRAAAAVLVEAGRSTAPQAPASAARWYGSALRLLPEDDPGRLELVIARATASGTAGNLRECHADLIEALGRLPADSGARAGLVAFCAGVERLLGRHHQAQARLLRELGAIPDERSAGAAALKVELSAAACFANDFESSIAWAFEALAVARPLGDLPLELTCEALASYADYSRGRTQDALRRVATVTSLLDGIDDIVLAQHPEAGFFAIWAEAALERRDDTIRHCERVLAASRAAGKGQYLVPLMHGLTASLIATGRLGRATELAVTAVEASRLTGQAQALSSALFLQCWAATCSGDLRLALRAGWEAARVIEPLDGSVVKSGPSAFLAQALIEVGEPERAREEMLARGGGPDLAAFGRVCRTLAYEVLTRADLSAGDLAAAEEWADRAEAATDGFSLHQEAAPARRARAAVLLARGDADEAARVALVGADAAARSGAPVEAGRCRFLAGQALSRVGARDQALAELARAARELGACGARGYQRQVVAERRRLRAGGAGRAAVGGAFGLGSLSGRERDVAALVALGKTNRAIAAACFVSEKTVERHLSNIFAKLGVSSRAAVASRVSTAAASQRPPTGR